MSRTQVKGIWMTDLKTGNKVVVQWYSVDAGTADSVPSPQWFTGQARQYGGRVRLTTKADTTTPWDGARTVTYVFHREVA